jgi:thiamine biosynthesis lipoprotein
MSRFPRTLLISGLCFSNVLGCGDNDVQVFSEKQVMMDTYVSVTVYAETEPPNWREHVRVAFDAMREVERLTTSYNDSSEIGRINHAAGKHAIAVSAEVLQILGDAQRISSESDGAFDVTVLPLSQLWDVKSPTPRIPSDDEIVDKRKLVGYRKIVIDGSSVFLPDSGMGIDLGAIAKGYAVDRAVQVLRERNYHEIMVEAGGDLRAVAGPLTKGQRTIWVRHPRQPDELFAAIKLDEGAVATSGDYERSFEKAGRRYHHILDPQTGHPAAPTVSVTIVAETSELADATSTAVFVMGPERGMQFIESDPNLAGLIIYHETVDGAPVLKWKVSRNLLERIEILSK